MSDEDAIALLREIRDAMIQSESRNALWREESRAWIEESRKNRQRDVRRRRIIDFAILGVIFGAILLVVTGIGLMIYFD